MRFSLDSEIQRRPGLSAAELQGGISGQIVNAVRLGDGAYAAIEHCLSPECEIAAHSMPYDHPPVAASRKAVADVLVGGRREFGVGRGHGSMPPKAELALTPESPLRTEVSTSGSYLRVPEREAAGILT